ncbi:MAG: hypothetical protein A2X86_06375 [Bdellovibrionales bacterium GWA2_49_15]|nr:MAG: hypothetical protein A2X86_06375 [Bdellovibrionales bacterium GWA2_49_15]HAZ12102.1 hypothetical protein [Bdellovibrionales bacterium]
MKILCPIGIGELADKISILEIKKQKIKDQVKLKHINHELDSLRELVRKNNLTGLDTFIADLIDVNNKLWDVEDAIRLKDKAKDFGVEFVNLARQVYVYNDQRFALKDTINSHFGSEIVETKSYQKY